MRSRLSYMAVPLAALGACGGGDGGTQPTANAAGIRIANPHHERLLGLDERMRRVGLLRAVRDSRNRCRSVVAGTYQQDYEGLAMWLARCEDNREWAVFIGTRGQVQVRNCRHMQQLGLPLCRRFEAAPMAPIQPASNSSKG